jgi:hypothetical protein
MKWQLPPAATLIVTTMMLVGQGAQNAPPAPAQPIPYSHKLHVGTVGLKCSFCHENKDPGEFMGIPVASKCMTCHQSIKIDSPAIGKLAEYHKNNRVIPWVRIYQIPSYVFFSHRSHVQSGAACADCHGPVEQREALRKEVPTTMGACMDCHQKRKASNDCTFCHEQRN